MHYNFTDRRHRDRLNRGQSAFQNAGRDAPPARMQQGGGSALGMDQVNGNTISDGHAKERAAGSGEVTVYAFPELPSRGPGTVSFDATAMYLVGMPDGRKLSTERVLERGPVEPDRLRLAGSEEAQIKSLCTGGD